MEKTEGLCSRCGNFPVNPGSDFCIHCFVLLKYPDGQTRNLYDRTFGFEGGKVLTVDPVGTAKGLINTNLVLVQVRTRRHRTILEENLTAGMARMIGQALLDAADKVEPV